MKTLVTVEAIIEFIIMLTEHDQIPWNFPDDDDDIIIAEAVYNNKRLAYAFFVDEGMNGMFIFDEEDEEMEGTFFPTFTHPLIGKLGKIIMEKSLQDDLATIAKQLGMPQ